MTCKALKHEGIDMAAGGKGHARRPSQISEEEENARWDLIFKKDKQLDTLSDENPKDERDDESAKRE